jgi:hypothetical protein
MSALDHSWPCPVGPYLFPLFSLSFIGVHLLYFRLVIPWMPSGAFVLGRGDGQVPSHTHIPWCAEFNTVTYPTTMLIFCNTLWLGIYLDMAECNSVAGYNSE